MKKTIEKFKEIVDKYYHIIIFIFGILILYNTFNTDDRLNKKLDIIITNQKELKQEINNLDSLLKVTEYNLFIKYEIESLKTSKNVLYDWNTVVRTTIRPDDKMIEYDKKIEELQNKLK